jgi:hypothetical protein
MNDELYKKTHGSNEICRFVGYKKARGASL